LYIFLSVKPHPFFKREGTDIFCKVPVPMTKAALGGTVEVPTIDGSRAKVSVPSGSQPGTQFRLKGKGMSMLRSQQRGDMYVQLQVEIPVSLNKKQKQLLEDFEAEGGGERSHPESHGFFAKVKEFFEDLKD
jgi:molecular chaperone DnaJ